MNLSKRAVVLSTAALMVIGGGAAVAYWTNSSSSAGNASVANPALIVSAPTTPDGPLSPDASQRYVFHVTNSGNAPTTLSTVVFKVADSSGADWSYTGFGGLGCSHQDFSVGGVKVVNGSTETAFATQTMPANSTVNLAVTLTMLNEPLRDQSGCKGMTPPLYISVG